MMVDRRELYRALSAFFFWCDYIKMVAAWLCLYSWKELLRCQVLGILLFYTPANAKMEVFRMIAGQTRSLFDLAIIVAEIYILRNRRHASTTKHSKRPNGICKRPGTNKEPIRAI
jgi:hypothetical protein